MVVLRDIVLAHARWLETGGAQGIRADFGVTADSYEFFTDDYRSVRITRPRPRTADDLLRQIRSEGLVGLNLSRASFRQANLAALDMRGVVLTGADCSGAVFDECLLEGADLSDGDFSGASLMRAKLEVSTLKKVNLAGAKLRGANLSGADLTEATLEGADFSTANLSDCAAARAAAARAIFTDATMARIDLRYSNLEGAQFVRADAHESRFGNSICKACDLTEANFESADLTLADMHASVLIRIRLANARLVGANLTLSKAHEADMSGADLSSAILTGAEFDHAVMARAILRFADLRETSVVKLDEVSKKETVTRKSTGLAFASWQDLDLSWARVDRSAIVQMPLPTLHIFRHKLNLDGLASSSKKVFICHAHEDSPAAGRLYDRLVEAGFSPWLDKRDLRPGQDWRREIPIRIRASDAVVICFSAISIAKRGYVQNEFRLALEELRQMPTGRIFIIPVRLDACDVPLEFETFQYVDLWEADSMDRIIETIQSLPVADF